MDILNINEFKDKTGIEGQDIKIGILDSGVYLEQKEFEDTNITIKEITKNVENKSHGTAITSLIAGSEFGVSPKSEIYHAVVMNDRTASGKDWYNGLLYLKNREVDIVCMSMGTKANLSLGMRQEINRMFNKGMLFVAPAGNEGVTAIRYPANNDEFISVGGIDENRNISKTSNRHKNINAYAPSENIEVFTDLETKNIVTGTSFANAIFAGQLSLMISYARSKGKELDVMRFLNFYNINYRDMRKVFDMVIVKQALDIYLNL